MQKIINQKHEMIREEMSLDEAIKLFGKMKQDFKVELLQDLKTKDMCKIFCKSIFQKIFQDMFTFAVCRR